MLKHGIYNEDDCQGIDLELIKDFYGTTDCLPPRPPGHTGAGYLGDDEPDSDRNSSDEGDESDLDDLSQQIEYIASVGHSEFLPKPVKAPRASCPFTGDELHLYEAGLSSAARQKILPPGYGICADEWEDDHYPAVEIIRSGRKGGKEISVQLPTFIWYPRGHLWVLALSIMERILEDRIAD
ncbi:hypothetical protein GYMLUDRAFT_251303 [Collybiopsis luxurians FD-317 M1]|uniref:Uncharacterized protein n=1 Tax=Collybiopsis luxurians FD-317 M1 TaxID=944289 RepID=A0A0D0C3G4_9AGAR|nr:hypothetical protein GYMLUDRAFT_251303 [Collybiopsis luxurians FD-317 M1]